MYEDIEGEGLRVEKGLSTLISRVCFHSVGKDEVLKLMTTRALLLLILQLLLLPKL